MPSKQALLDNVDQYEASELVDYILEGLVTFEELCTETEGYFSVDQRREVKRMLSKHVEDEWRKTSEINTIDAYEAYLAKFPDSDYAADARVAIRRLENDRPIEIPQEPIASDSEWDRVNKNSLDDLNRFISLYPDDPHVRDARKLINQLIADGDNWGSLDPSASVSAIDELKNLINRLQTDKSILNPNAKILQEILSYYGKKKVSTREILDMIAEDHNILHASVVQGLIGEGVITYNDLVNIGIDSRFVRQLASGEVPVPFAAPEKLERINKQSTEIYFWGIPSSGKSCAIGAILNVANNGKVAYSMTKDNDCQGYGYMTRLPQLFRSDGVVGMLPPGTPVSSTYEMGFDLIDFDNKLHPITLIDLAGELIRCMYKFNAHEDMSEEDLEALDTLTRVLIDNRTSNRKIHFFVLEYGGENRLYEGLPQSAYLDGALEYIRSTKIFDDATDAIYLLISKADKTGQTGQALIQILKQYIESNYKGFYNGLKYICQKHSINGGNVDVIPFTLGEVCFQDYCLFREGPAANVVRTLLERSKGFRFGKFWNAVGKFKE